MASITTLFKRVDFLGNSFGFEHKGTTRFRTLEGACFSMVTITAALIVAIMFGREVYQRKAPVVSLSEEKLTNSRVYMREFPFALMFYDNSVGEIKKPEELFMYRVTKTHVNKTTLFTSTEYNYTLVKCKDYVEKFTKHQDLINAYSEGSVLTPYCINFDENMFFQDEYGIGGSTFVSVYVLMCDKRFSSTCKYDKSMNRQINDAGGFSITTMYLDAYVDSNSFENPIKPIRSISSIITGPGMIKLIYLGITNDLFVSDDGWLLEDYRNINYYKRSSVFIDSNYDDNPLIFGAILTSPNIRLKYSRSYLKIQELFARVGGIANAFTIVTYIISYHYLRFKYIFFVRKNSIENIDLNSYNNYEKVNLNFQKNAIEKGDKINLNPKSVINNEEMNNSISSNIHMQKNNLNSSKNEEGRVKNKINNYINHNNNNNNINLTNNINNNNNLLNKHDNSDVDCKSRRKENSVNKEDSQNKLNNPKLQKLRTFQLEVKSLFFEKNLNNNQVDINGNLIKLPNAVTEECSNEKEFFSYFDYIYSILCCKVAKNKLIKLEIKKVESFLSVNNFHMFLVKSYYSYFKDLSNDKKSESNFNE